MYKLFDMDTLIHCMRKAQSYTLYKLLNFVKKEKKGSRIYTFLIIIGY